MNKAEARKLRRQGIRVCGHCYKTDRETKHYDNPKTGQYLCVKCRSEYVKRNRVSSPKPPPQRMYTETMELLEATLLKLNNAGRIEAGTVADMMRGIHFDSRKARRLENELGRH